MLWISSNPGMSCCARQQMCGPPIFCEHKITNVEKLEYSTLYRRRDYLNSSFQWKVYIERYSWSSKSYLGLKRLGWTTSLKEGLGKRTYARVREKCLNVGSSMSEASNRTMRVSNVWLWATLSVPKGTLQPLSFLLLYIQRHLLTGNGKADTHFAFAACRFQASRTNENSLVSEFSAWAPISFRGLTRVNVVLIGIARQPEGSQMPVLGFGKFDYGLLAARVKEIQLVNYSQDYSSCSVCLIGPGVTYGWSTNPRLKSLIILSGSVTKSQDWDACTTTRQGTISLGEGIIESLT